MLQIPPRSERCRWREMGFEIVTKWAHKKNWQSSSTYFKIRENLYESTSLFQNVRKTEWVLSAYNDAVSSPSLSWRVSPNEETESFDFHPSVNRMTWDGPRGSDCHTLTLKRHRPSRVAPQRVPSSLRLNFQLLKGLGVSVVSQALDVPEELAYISLTKVITEVFHNGSELQIDGSIENIQVCVTQLFQHDAIPISKHGV
jgi:hypothetical protein